MMICVCINKDYNISSMHFTNKIKNQTQTESKIYTERFQHSLQSNKILYKITHRSLVKLNIVLEYFRK